jgi:tetratricopeptide (TPR) repeat protein
MEIVPWATPQPESASKLKLLVPVNGNFDFGALAPGDYKVRVRDLSGNVLIEQVQTISGSKLAPILLFVQDPIGTLADANIVSFSSLQHKTPKRAWHALETAKKTFAFGDERETIKHLREALDLDPDFPEAHSDLAVIYARQGRLDEALEQAQTAFRLNPRLTEAGCNLALLLMNLKRYPEAESAARGLLSDPYSTSIPHGVLAISLIEQRKNLDEALSHLSKAAPAFPFFRLLVANAFSEIRRADLAVIQVNEYLRSSAHDCERPALEAWLANVERRLTLLP